MRYLTSITRVELKFLLALMKDECPLLETSDPKVMQRLEAVIKRAKLNFDITGLSSYKNNCKFSQRPRTINDDAQDYKISVLKKIVHKFSSEGLEFLLVKGVALSSTIYGSPFERKSQDIDILVHPEHLSQACQAFYELGFSQKYITEVGNKAQSNVRPQRNGVPPSKLRSKAYSNQVFPFKASDDNKVAMIDLHDGIYFIDQAQLSGIFKRANRIRLEDTMIPIPSDEDALLVLLLTAYENSETIFSTLIGYRSI